MNFSDNFKTSLPWKVFHRTVVELTVLNFTPDWEFPFVQPKDHLEYFSTWQSTWKLIYYVKNNLIFKRLQKKIWLGKIILPKTTTQKIRFSLNMSFPSIREGRRNKTTFLPVHKQKLVKRKKLKRVPHWMRDLLENI